jgi:hypothetical protein
MEDQVPQSERRSGPRKKTPGKATPSTPRGGGDGEAPPRTDQSTPAIGPPKSGHSRSILVESGEATSLDAEQRPLGSPADERGRAEEFEFLGSDNPLAAVFGALAVGIAVGFVLGRVISKD